MAVPLVMEQGVSAKVVMAQALLRNYCMELVLLPVLLASMRLQIINASYVVIPVAHAVGPR